MMPSPLRRVKAGQAAEELAAKPGEYDDQGFVFSDKHGHPIKLDAPTKAFREIADIAKLPREITLHSLRHSFASWSIANGGDIVGVQRVLGHSVPSTTLNLYSHAVASIAGRGIRPVPMQPRFSRSFSIEIKRLGQVGRVGIALAEWCKLPSGLNQLKYRCRIVSGMVNEMPFGEP